MSQVLKDEITYSTNSDKIEFSVQFEFSTESTEIEKSESQIFSLGVSDNESLEDAEQDMKNLIKNSIKDWQE